MSYTAEQPIQYTPDPSKFGALVGGDVYFGVPNGNPASVPGDRIQVYLARQGLSDLAIAQPVDIGPGGVWYYNGSPAQIKVLVPYCVQILNSLGVQKYYAPAAGDEITKFNAIDAEQAAQNIEIAKSVKTVATFVDLSTTTATIGQQVCVPGVGIFDVVSTSGLTANAGTIAVNGSIAFKLISSQPVDPKALLAVGDGTANDTSSSQNAATVSRAVTVTEGTYKLSSAGTTPAGNFYAVSLPDNTTMNGVGGIFNLSAMGFYGLTGIGKSNLAINNVRLTGTGHAGNDAASCAIWLSGESADVWNLSVSFNSIVDTSWGALIRCQLGTGVAKNVRMIGNDVHSTTPGTMADGLHAVGKIQGIAIAANTVQGRADAGIAMNAAAGFTGYGFAIAGNASVDNLVGVDVSGASYGVVVGNVCYNTVNHAASNPTLRAITFSGQVPKNVIFSSNMAIGNHAASSEVDVKIDTAGADAFMHVNDNQLVSFYTNAGHVSLADNYFIGATATASFDNNSSNIHIGTNTWTSQMSISGQGNAGLAGYVNLKKQNWTRWTPANFLPTYSSANPFWENKWFLDSDVRLVTNESFVTASAVAVDVTNAVIYLRFPCILDAIIGVADCATHSGHLSLTDMANVEKARVDFAVTAGVGGTNVMSSALTFPSTGGNAYKPKLAAGVYKIRAYSDLNNLTVKTVSVAIWD